MSAPLTAFGDTFLRLVWIVDPLGTAAAFAGLVASAPRPAPNAARLAHRASLTATALLVGSAFIGQWLVRTRLVDLDALRAAGGLLLLASAWPMVRDGVSTSRPGADLALSPLAVPLLAGPASIAASIEGMARGDGSLGHVGGVMLAIGAVQATAHACLLGAPRLLALLGTGGVAIAIRLTGLWLTVLALESAVGGAARLWQQTCSAGVY